MEPAERIEVEESRALGTLWTCHVTYDREEPAGAAALYVAGGSAWLGRGSTPPAAQGASLLVTETRVAGDDGPGASYRNILRAGFREAYARPNFIRP